MTAVIGTIPGASEIISTDKDTHFTTELLTNAIEEEDISFPSTWVTTGTQTVEIRNITVQSDQQLQWDIQFYATDAHSNTDLDLDKFVTNVNFATSDGVQNAGTAQFRYDKNPTFIPFMYTDEDNTSEFHITLVNRDGTKKNAGASGEIVIKVHAVPVI
ncbi:MAG TPA: hypothetical protein ENH85_06395 [Candidatus Scalindua sp.]|nr:hypothetical protein [Candidatus Scalindua sp.]